MAIFFTLGVALLGFGMHIGMHIGRAEEFLVMASLVIVSYPPTCDRKREILKTHIFWDAVPILAAEYGYPELVERGLSHPGFDPKDSKVMDHVIIEAILAGHLDVVRTPLESRGRQDSAVREIGEATLTTGMVRSPLVEFCSQLSNLLASILLGECPIKLFPSGNDRLLCDVAFASPQRVDVVEWLLEQGASVQDRLPPKHRYDSERALNRYGACSPCNPLRQTVQGGNKKIVRLLLERGADPNATDNDVLEQAVLRGRLDIVRMLVEHGVHVKDKEPPTRHSKIGRQQESLVQLALLTENEKRCRYLIANGARIGLKALPRAAKRSLESMVRLLIDHGAIVTRKLVKTIEKKGDMKIATLLRSRLDTTEAWAADEKTSGG
jgi:ankyrin repeat protein